MDKEQQMQFHFYSNEPPGQKLLGDDRQKRVAELSTLAGNIKNTLDSTGLMKWEVALEGYLEASSGLLPGGKAGFKATIKIAKE